MGGMRRDAVKGIADLCAPKGNCTHTKISTSWMVITTVFLSYFCAVNFHILQYFCCRLESCCP